jgi:hypothetical protein
VTTGSDFLHASKGHITIATAKLKKIERILLLTVMIGPESRHYGTQHLWIRHTRE